MSPQMLQKCMVLFEKDIEMAMQRNLDLMPISKLAKIGSAGSQPSHCWRDLQRWLPKAVLPPLHYMFLPMRHAVLGRFFKKVPLMLPHHIFPAIFHHFPKMFDQLVYGSPDRCRQFWRAVKSSEQFRLCFFIDKQIF